MEWLKTALAILANFVSFRPMNFAFFVTIQSFSWQNDKVFNQLFRAVRLRWCLTGRAWPRSLSPWRGGGAPRARPPATRRRFSSSPQPRTAREDSAAPPPRQSSSSSRPHRRRRTISAVWPTGLKAAAAVVLTATTTIIINTTATATATTTTTLWGWAARPSGVVWGPGIRSLGTY